MIDGLLSNDAVMQNKRRNKMVESEVRLSASQLRVRPSQWVELAGQSELRPLGPIELALEVWWQAWEWQKWWEKNIRTPGVRDPGLLAVGARLQLRCANQLVQLYRHVSAPRRGSVQSRTPVFHSGT